MHYPAKILQNSGDSPEVGRRLGHSALLNDKLCRLVESEGLSLNQVYNADETGLYFRSLPSNTLANEKEKSTVQPPDPYDEEKGEARTGSSATTPGSVTTPGDSRMPRPVDPLVLKKSKQGSNASPQDEIETYFSNMADYFLSALMDGKTQDPYVQMYLSLCDREIRQSGRHSLHTNFSLDHPIEEAGRLLSATLLRHTHLTPQLIEVLEQGKFVFYEVRPASCGDVEALEKFAVRGVSRWRKVTQLLRLRSNDTTATTQEKDQLQVSSIVARCS
ncbi:putative E3 ubiquitin-protein ligase HERC2 [Chionoecetes opilio]|uniref:Putative E3 ubiquitin-protein ligase HERC2 n=1 Tax=Chionoecetes opilio TaxID=41210 RepID=A0A8J4XT98_CHIOP|nr:putative E3 ubiquitin-protein ligase HERC2 [Chionoecetes opilio]